MKIAAALMLTTGVIVASGCTGQQPKATGEQQSPTAAIAKREPLTDFSCTIEVTGVPGTIKAGSDRFGIRATVTNISRTAWPAATTGSVDQAVNVGAHIDVENNGVR